MPSRASYDAVVVGGGFYGASIAVYLKQRLANVLLLEREPELMSRASYANQARIHGGYHYPRSLQTAYRCRVSFNRFVEDFPDCVVDGFDKIYGIARNFSHVTPRQFERVCAVIGAPLRPARPEYAKLFDKRMLAAVYEVKECAFDSRHLRENITERLQRAGVEVCLATAATGMLPQQAGEARLTLSCGAEVEARHIFHCTYANLKSVPGLSDQCREPLKLEIAEMALIEPPPELRTLGVTVMCGPFFSTMPFPPRSLHTLSHVRYTPHCSWKADSSEGLPAESGISYARHMLQDAQRYLPVLGGSKVVGSLREVKALLTRNELDDGRPILVERTQCGKTAVYTILGGKIDNIYDVYERLREDGL